MKRLNRRIHFFIISCLAFMIFPPYVSLAADTQSLESKLDQFISQHEDSTAGLAAMVIQGNEVIVRKSIGYANIEEGLKVNEESVFEWGSISKIVIWISMMQLLEEGLIELNQDIQHYLPGSFQLPSKFEEPIQLLDLMNHTAGFDDSYTDIMLHNPSEMPSLKEALENTDVKQVFRPGDVVAYSNYGAALAAYIVETVSGQDYRDYVNDHIFLPLGMTRTSIDPLQNDNQWVKVQREKMQGYTTENQPAIPDLLAIPIYPAGSIMGTIDDLALLLTALLSEDGRPLFKKEETIQLLFQPTDFFLATDTPRMAHGLFSLPAEIEVFGHGGNTIAFSSSLYLSRENRLGVIVMTNQANETNFGLGIPDLIFGKPKFSSLEEYLESSAAWAGIYQPARMPYHGFSKIYGLANRATIKQHGQHNLMANSILYTQQNPGIYMTEEEFSIYSYDRYSVHPTYGNILSTSTGDVIQISRWRHLFEWGLLIAGMVAALFSLFYIGIAWLPKFRKTTFHLAMTVLNLFNLLIICNLAWMFYKAFSMTTYESLKIHMILNIAYLVITGVISASSMFLNKKFQFNKAQTTYFLISILSAILLCANIVYWEFYR